jgi:hypothetical protein
MRPKEVFLPVLYQLFNILLKLRRINPDLILKFLCFCTLVRNFGVDSCFELPLDGLILPFNL